MTCEPQKNEEAVMRRLRIVLANQTKAKILEYQGRIRGINLVEVIDHPRGRLHERELNTDRPGTTVSDASPVRHAYGTPGGSHENEAQEFARSLAAELAKQRKEDRFDDLMLVAEPRFYGKLRAALDRGTWAKVVTVLQRDIVNLPDHELKEYLRKQTEDYDPLLSQAAG